MRLLLDTHIFIWAINNDRLLSKTARSKILDASEVYISSASIWEVAIKIKLGKIEADIKQLIEMISKSGFVELPITTLHAATFLQLPDIHKDPFDRILIAQAISEPLTFVTADVALSGYSDLIEIVN